MRILLAALAVLTVVYVIVWAAHLKHTWHTRRSADPLAKDPGFAAQMGIGFFANFFDTLGDRLIRHYEFYL